jgi:hypothetical protein
VTLDPAGAALEPGTYTGTLALTGSCAATGAPAEGSPGAVAVNLTVTSAGPTQADPASSCAQLVQSGLGHGDGLYWIREQDGTLHQTYCDLTVDGGGWAMLFSGKNGHANVFDHFDAGFYSGSFTDPSAAQFLRRAPAGFADRSAELAVSCGGAWVAFPVTKALHDWLIDGTGAGWVPVSARALTGTVPTLPDAFYTGYFDRSFIVSKGTGFDGVFGSSYAASPQYDSCNAVPDTSSTLRIYYRESAPTAVRNDRAGALPTCAHVLRAGAARGDGIYWLSEPGGTPYQAYCEMTTLGGGWTSVYAGRNGSPNVIDHLDAGLYHGVCTDPATRCVRHASPALGDGAADLLASCGGSSVRLPITEVIRKWLVSGTNADWTSVEPTRVAGAGPSPRALYTGNPYGGYPGFLLAGSSSAGASTFASGFDSFVGDDYCDGVFDQASLVRLSYRTVDPAPVRNTAASPATSCRAARDAGGTQSGTYWLQEPGGQPYQAFCDQETLGGGWTAAFSGRNGQPNFFGRFNADGPGYAETCPDPGSRCLRRIPASATASAAEVAVSCGGAMSTAALTEGARKFLALGQGQGWVGLTPLASTGPLAEAPNTLWTGGFGDPGFIFTRGQSYEGTLASSYGTSPQYDFCAGQPDRSSFVHVYYREQAPVPVLNAPEAARTSCRAVLQAGESRGDGAYWLQQGAGAAYQAYCDMTTAGGGWTAVFAGRNGSPNVFDWFEDSLYRGACTDAASRCVRRAGIDVSDATLAVSCGGAMVAFPMPQAVRDYLQGGVRAQWVPLLPTVLAGSVAQPPDWMWTGGIGASTGFIFARDRDQAKTFASSHDESPAWDACNGAPDQTSLVRVFYR